MWHLREGNSLYWHCRDSTRNKSIPLSFRSGTQYNRSVSSRVIYRYREAGLQVVLQGEPTPVPEISVQSAQNSYNITTGWDVVRQCPPILLPPPFPRPTVRELTPVSTSNRAVERESGLNKLSVVCYKNDNANSVRHVLD